VDVRSPINQSGLIFYDTLFDENAVCHIAFGRAYPEGVVGAEHMSEDAQLAFGINASNAHEDLMIGTPTMQVTGLCADGSQLAVMRDGQFVLGAPKDVR
jgi:aminopeptidase